MAGLNRAQEPGSGTQDPRAVRVRLAPASRLASEPGIRVAPVPAPLEMGNPTAGHGPLGGVAMPPLDAAPARDRPGVLAQRQVLLDGEPAWAALQALGHGRYALTVGDVRTTVVLGPRAGAEGGARRQEVLVDGFRFEVDVEPERIAALRERATRGRNTAGKGGPLEVRAIIPGRVAGVSVAPGDAVVAGQQLLVVEAMKMQNELRAPRDGTIDRVGVAPGANIEVGDLLVIIS